MMLSNPLIPIEARLEIAKGAISFRDEIIINKDRVIKELDDYIDRLKNAKSCPNCNNVGWYVVANTYTGEPEQEQCEFCYTEKDSLFNVINEEKA